MIRCDSCSSNSTSKVRTTTSIGVMSWTSSITMLPAGPSPPKRRPNSSRRPSSSLTSQPRSKPASINSCAVRSGACCVVHAPAFAEQMSLRFEVSEVFFDSTLLICWCIRSRHVSHRIFLTSSSNPGVCHNDSFARLFCVSPPFLTRIQLRSELVEHQISIVKDSPRCNGRADCLRLPLLCCSSQHRTRFSTVRRGLSM